MLSEYRYSNQIAEWMANICHIATDRDSIVGLQVYIHEHLSTRSALQEIQVLQESRLFFLNQHHVHEIQDSRFHQRHISYIIITLTRTHAVYACARNTSRAEPRTALDCYLGPFSAISEH